MMDYGLINPPDPSELQPEESERSPDVADAPQNKFSDHRQRLPRPSSVD
jgi:hypothetical protein